MKLRNKTSGEEVHIWEIIIEGRAYNTLADIKADYEDINPTKPLITDEKVRKAVRAWADANDYKKCTVRVCDYDRAGVYCKKGVISFLAYETMLPLTFFNIGIDIKTDEVYTIDELCGEEENDM